MTTLIVATDNPKKLKEIRELIQGLDFEVRSLADYEDSPIRKK